jgi:hypothetical protein
MNTRVIYSTEGFLHKNQGQPGRQCDLRFASTEDAKRSPLPNGFTTAFIFVEDGVYIYSSRFSGFGWEFHKKSPNLAMPPQVTPASRAEFPGP